MFTPRHLTDEQRQQITTPLLQQAEERALLAYLNHHLNPADAALKAHWEQLRDQLVWLEAQVAQWGSFSP